MPPGDVHTAHSEQLRRWYSYVEGNGECFGVEYRKDRAIRIGNLTAKSRETTHIVHRRDGSIDYRNSFADVGETAGE